MSKEELEKSKREIKFRAWRDDQMYGDQKSKVWLMNKIKCNYMQFTGLKDKNGKEIYEGDILQCTDLERDVMNVVFWSDKKVGWAIENGNNYLIELSGNIKSRKVIGNIYEDPKLL